MSLINVCYYIITFQQQETADNIYDLAGAFYCPYKPLVVIFVATFS